MSKVSSLWAAVCLLALLAISGVETKVQAQSQLVTPVPFNRFIVSNVDLGTLLTANYAEGANLNFLYYPFPEQADIVLPPAAGWTPAPGQGLLPLYRWKVSQNGRIYYYYSVYYTTLGSDYTYEGVAGYVLPADGSYGGIALACDYSQSRGYYFSIRSATTPIEPIPGNSGNQHGFNYHGITCRLPQGGTYSFNPPPPPPACSAGSGVIRKCSQLGGYWDFETCSCQY